MEAFLKPIKIKILYDKELEIVVADYLFLFA